MQYGPVTPPNTTESTTDHTTDGAIAASEIDQDRSLHASGDQEVHESNDQPGQIAADGAVVNSESEASGESFFQTWAKGQEMPLGSSMMFLGGILLALLVIMRSLRKSSARRRIQTHSMAEPAERIEKIRTHASASMDPARRAMVEAEEMARRLGAVLDNKATRIEILLDEVNERIARLEEVTARPIRPIGDSPTHPEHRSSNQVPRNRTVHPEALDRARLDQDRAERQWVETRPADAHEETQSTEPTFRIDRGFKEPPLPESPNPMTFPEMVDELAVKGLNAMEIANKLNRPVGEVELVLNLRKRAT